MKVMQIMDVLDLTKKIREQGGRFNPLFVGDAGLGKSQVIQQWVKKQRETNKNFGYIDLRLSYLESPDMIGYPDKAQINGEWRQINALPDFWPTEGEGLLVLEEVNLAQPSVLNTLMQLLTEGKVHNYIFPEGWIICGAINPDTDKYNVTQMSLALQNRFEQFEIEYNKQTFIEYIEKRWDEQLVAFLKSSQWAYMAPDKLATKDGKEEKYISPRTWDKVNTAEKAGLKENPAMHRIVCTSELGADVGSQYHAFCFDDSPIFAADILKNKQEALKKLKKQSGKGKNYRGDLLSVTVEDLVKNFCGELTKENSIDWTTLFEVAETIHSDQAVNLLVQALSSEHNKMSINDVKNSMPEKLHELLKTNLGAK